MNFKNFTIHIDVFSFTSWAKVLAHSFTHESKSPFMFGLAPLPISWKEDNMVLCWVTFAASTSFLSSSMSRFSLARRFWNHVITWALVKPSDCAISSRSAGDRYFWCRNLLSSSKIWWLVKAVLDFLFFLGWARLLNKHKWSLEGSEMIK